MTPVTMKIEAQSQKATQFKVLYIVTISKNLKAIVGKLLEILRKQSKC